MSRRARGSHHGPTGLKHHHRPTAKAGHGRGGPHAGGRRIHRPHRPGGPDRIGTFETANVVIIIIAAVVAVIFFWLGKYFEFNSPGAYDSGSYVYSAAHILDGARIGVEEKPSAQLGTLLVNILGVRIWGYYDTGPKIIQTLLQGAALILMFLAMRKLFGPLGAGVGVVLATIYLSSPLVAKYGNVKEQYMIAFMLMGASCLVFYELNGKWWWALLAGAFLSWAPLFKQTGMSALGAAGLFVLAGPVLKHKSWRQTGRDVLLLVGGAAAALTPLYVWMLGWRVQMALPYSFVWETLGKMIPSGGGEAKPAADYISGSRKLVPFSEQWPRVLRYYGLFILPIGLAIGSIAARAVRMILRYVSAGEAKVKQYDRFVLLLGIWWILDMAFVWISPRSYEQYYLPLNASAAMLGGYVVALCADWTRQANSKIGSAVLGSFAFFLMIALSWHVFFGITKSPHTGKPYPAATKGYSQKLREVQYRRKNKYRAPWERAGKYIKDNSTATDKIYVWGWIPGIYMEAKRFSSASKAFCMPRPAPAVMEQMVSQLLSEFGKEMPKFIVDTRKRHIPTERPPYELWPIVWQDPAGPGKTWFLPRRAEAIEEYDGSWSRLLAERYGKDEAARYTALGPFRKFVMDNYEIAEAREYFVDPDGQLLHRRFGEHVILRLRSGARPREQR